MVKKNSRGMHPHWRKKKEQPFIYYRPLPLDKKGRPSFNWPIARKSAISQTGIKRLSKPSASSTHIKIDEKKLNKIDNWSYCQLFNKEKYPFEFHETEKQNLSNHQKEIFFNFFISQEKMIVYKLLDELWTAQCHPNPIFAEDTEKIKKKISKVIEPMDEKFFNEVIRPYIWQNKRI